MITDAILTVYKVVVLLTHKDSSDQLYSPYNSPIYPILAHHSMSQHDIQTDCLGQFLRKQDKVELILAESVEKKLKFYWIYFYANNFQRK